MSGEGFSGDFPTRMIAENDRLCDRVRDLEAGIKTAMRESTSHADLLDRLRKELEGGK